MSMSINEFLLARIAEDEREANICLAQYQRGEGGSTPRWTRQLAECAAKRAIVDVATSWEHSYMDEDMWYSCPLAVAPGEMEEGSGYSGDEEAVCRCGLEARQLKLLQPLAAVYSDHPDYQQEWAA